MNAPDNSADKFVLLFSTDWFRPHWALTGFVPRAEVAVDFQHCMRDLVGSMMEDADSYWLINFSESRLNHTRDALLAALDRYSSDDSKLDLLRTMVAGGDTREALTDVSMTFWNDYDAMLDELGRAPISETDWDRGIVALTPDLPSLLQTFAIVDLLQVI